MPTWRRAPTRRLIAEGVGLPPEAIAPGQDVASYGVEPIAGLRIMQRVQQLYGDRIPMLTIVHGDTGELSWALPLAPELAQHGAACGLEAASHTSGGAPLSAPPAW